MKSGLHVLVICNDHVDADGVGQGLVLAGYDVYLKWVSTEQGLQDTLAEKAYDLVLCDDKTSDVDTVTARNLIADIGSDIPFIVISSTMTPEAQKIASQMKAGVDDFVEWGKPEHLIPAVERALRASETRRLNKLAEQEMHFRANFDSLTGLPNRTLMFDRLSQALKSARRNESGVLLMYLDLDHFKDVNDSMGHLAGDQLLRQASERITSVLRDSDTAARIGGDEFAIILPEAEDTATAELIAGKLLGILSTAFKLDTQQTSISASIGITRFPNDGDEPTVLLENADQAMYAAKRMGRNAFQVYSDISQAQPLKSHLPGNDKLPLPITMGSGFSYQQAGFAFAAVLAILVVASVWMTSMNTKDALKVAIEENLETLTDFSTASGPED